MKPERIGRSCEDDITRLWYLVPGLVRDQHRYAMPSVFGGCITALAECNGSITVRRES